MEQNEVTTMVLEFFKTYGWQLCLIACSGIFILGAMKAFGIFDKVPQDKKKYIFGGISTGISIIASAIYLLCTNGFEWVSFGVLAGTILAMNNALYTAYENYGFKAIVKKIGQALLIHVYNLSSTRLEQKKLIENPAKIEKKTNAETKQEEKVEEEDVLQ